MSLASYALGNYVSCFNGAMGLLAGNGTNVTLLVWLTRRRGLHAAAGRTRKPPILYLRPGLQWFYTSGRGYNSEASDLVPSACFAIVLYTQPKSQGHGLGSHLDTVLVRFTIPLSGFQS